MSRRGTDDEAGLDRDRLLRSPSGSLRRPSAAMRLIRQASTRGFMREPSIRVREAAEEQVEQRQSDLAYSWPVVVLDLLWNAGFIAASLIVLGLSVHENPSAPLRLWIFGYSAQCLVHIVCVWSEYQRRQELRRIASSTSVSRRRANDERVTGRDSTAISISSPSEGTLSEALLRQRRAQDDQSVGTTPAGMSRDEEQGGESDREGGMEIEAEADDLGSWNNSLARQVESINTMFSFVWWVVGLGWLLSTFDDTFQDSPLLSWLCMIFLAFDVFFVIFCTALACVIGIAVCCCLPCIIALLFAVGDKDGASLEAIEALPRFKFLRAPTNSSSPEKDSISSEGSQAGGFIVPLEAPSDRSKERLIATEDAECCICLCGYEDGAFLRELPCGHHFDQSCLDKWLRTKPTCPLCKFDIVRKTQQGGSADSLPAQALGAEQPVLDSPGGAQAPPSLINTIRASAGGFFTEGSTSSPA